MIHGALNMLARPAEQETPQQAVTTLVPHAVIASHYTLPISLFSPPTPALPLISSLPPPFPRPPPPHVPGIGGLLPPFSASTSHAGGTSGAHLLSACDYTEGVPRHKAAGAPEAAAVRGLLPGYGHT